MATKTSASAASSVPAASFDKKAYQCIYPQYIDSNLKPSEGRRVSLANAVANPSFQEIGEALKHLGFNQVFFDQTKSLPSAQAQPRQNPAPKGVIRVQIKTPQNQHYIKKSEFDVATRQATVAAAPNKNQLLIKIAAFIKAKHGDARPALPRTAVEVAKDIQAEMEKANAPVVKGKKN